VPAKEAHHSRDNQGKRMTGYRRFYIPGSIWFFTVNLAERRNNRLLVDRVDSLKSGVRLRQEAQAFCHGSGGGHA
jgi:hypothetical protein